MSDSDEEDGEHKAFREKHAFLCDRMESSGLRIKLYSENHLTQHETDAICTTRSKLDRNVALLDAVRSRSNAVLIRFCELLFEDNQAACGTALMEAFEKHGIDVSNLKKLKKSQKPPVPAHRAPQYVPSLEELAVPFAALSTAVKKFVVGQEDLKTWSLSLLSSMKLRTWQKQEIDEVMKEISHCESNEQIFVHLQTLDNSFQPLDISLYENLVELACEETEELKQLKIKAKLKNYKAKLQVACETTLEACKKEQLKEQRGGTPDDTVSIGVQTLLTPQHTGIQFILDMKQYFVEYIHVAETAFEGFSCSNVTLFFSVSKDRLPFLVHWCFLHRRDLMEKFSVELVFSPGHFVYSLYADQEYPYPQAVLPQPQPVVPEKEPVDVLSEKEKNLTPTLQDAIWSEQIAFEKKNDQFKSELHVKISDFQRAIQSMISKSDERNSLETKRMYKQLEKVLSSLEVSRKKKSHSELESPVGVKWMEYLNAKLDDISLKIFHLQSSVASKETTEPDVLMAAKLSPSSETAYAQSVLPVPVHVPVPTVVPASTGVQGAVGPSKPTAVRSPKKRLTTKVGIIMTPLRRTTEVSFLRYTARCKDSKFQYRLGVVGKQALETADNISNADVLGKNVSEALSKIFQSSRSESPSIIVEARFGHMVWKTQRALHTDFQCPIHQLERNGEIDVSYVMSRKDIWSIFETVCEQPNPHAPSSIQPFQKHLGMTPLGQIDAVLVTFTLCAPHEDSLHYLVSSNVLPGGRCQFVRVNPRTKEKEFAFDCVPLLGNLDFRISLSSVVSLSDDITKSSLLTEIGTDLAKHMSLKSHEVVFDEPPVKFRVSYVRHTKKQLYLMTHEGQSYIFAECNVENCMVGRTDLPEDSAVYPLTDCHRELELWNCQWKADFFQLEGKDWREYFASNGCDVSMIQVSPRPVQVGNIVRELGAYVRCALKIAEVA